MTEISPMGDILAHLAPGKTVYVSGTSVESQTLINFLKAHPQASNGVRFVAMQIPGINRFDYASLHPEARSVVFFPLQDNCQSLLEGRAELVPVSYYGAYRHIEQHINLDVAFIHVSPPDRNGNCNLGLAADFSALAFSRAATRVALVNSSMPETCGNTTLPAAEFDLLVDAQGPLVSIHSAPPAEPYLQVGKNIVRLIRDGDTVQLGLGTLQAAVLSALRHKRGLKIFSGMITQSVMDLVNAGAVAPQDGSIVTGMAVGGPEFSNWLHHNPLVRFCSADLTHAPDAGLENNRFAAINSAVEVDLLGQVNGEVQNGQFISSSGGLTDFMRAAGRHPDGCPIIALPSTGRKGTISRIVPALAAGVPVSLQKSDPLIIVTEHGIADLRHLGLDERAAAIISVAAPSHREYLEHDWRVRRDQLFSPKE